MVLAQASRGEEPPAGINRHRADLNVVMPRAEPEDFRADFVDGRERRDFTGADCGRRLRS